ncbi:MAG: AAA family ATPase [Geminicoccaceae bacterium]
MRLDELVVEDFRKLQGRHVLRPAPLGITVVSGDNEEGKSTLLDALKAAFFMKHNTTGADRDAIQPFAGGETPAVTVGFTLAGHAYRLAKRFRRGGVQLETPEGPLEGDAAELRLASLLQFEWPGRGAARDTHTGVAGLFWVDQGTTFAKEQGPSPTALRGLQPALADQVAMLGRGEQAPRLMTEVRRRRDQHWTGKRDPAGRLATLEREVAELQSELARLVAEEAAVEALLDRLAVTLEKRRAWLAADHLGRARQAVEGTRSALARVKALEEEQRVRAAERQAAASELRRLQGMAELRGQRRAAIAERAAEQAKLAAAAAGNAPLLERARVLRGGGGRGGGREPQGGGGGRARPGDPAPAGRAAAAGGRARRARTPRGGCPGDGAGGRPAGPRRRRSPRAFWPSWRRRRPGSGRRESGASRRGDAAGAAAERADARVLLDDVPVDPAAPIELTAPAVFALDGFGRIEVTPGGERLAELRRAARRWRGGAGARLAGLAAPAWRRRGGWWPRAPRARARRPGRALRPSGRAACRTRRRSRPPALQPAPGLPASATWRATPGRAAIEAAREAAERTWSRLGRRTRRWPRRRQAIEENPAGAGGGCPRRCWGAGRCRAGEARGPARDRAGRLPTRRSPSAGGGARS